MIHIKRFVISTIAAVSIAASACEAVPPPPLTIPPPAQVVGTTHLEGDSVTLNTYYLTTVRTDYATTTEFSPGARVDWAMTGDPAMVTVPNLARYGQVDRIVWALGLNEMFSDEGFSIRYQLIWQDVLINKLPPKTCIVMVKPWILSSGNTTRSMSRLPGIRAWMDKFAAAHSNVVLVDWEPFFSTHPEISPDGTHMTPDSAGPAARDAMYREGLSRCPQRTA